MIITDTNIYPKRLLNVKEAANYLGVSESYIYKFIEFGEISYRRLPGLKIENKNRQTGKLVFEIKDLNQFIEEKSIRYETTEKKTLKIC